MNTKLSLLIEKIVILMNRQDLRMILKLSTFGHTFFQLVLKKFFKYFSLMILLSSHNLDNRVLTKMKLDIPNMNLRLQNIIKIWKVAKFIASYNKIKQVNESCTLKRWSPVHSQRPNYKNINKRNSYFLSTLKSLWLNKSNFFKMMTHLQSKDIII